MQYRVHDSDGFEWGTLPDFEAAMAEARMLGQGATVVGEPGGRLLFVNPAADAADIWEAA